MRIVKLLLAILFFVSLALISIATLQDNEQPSVQQHPTAITREPFNFENFKTREALQNELDRILPVNSSLSEIDTVLVEEGKAYHSDNLYEDSRTGQLHKGTTSEENIIYYYKPLHPAGENGWEDTNSGWVIKITHQGEKLHGFSLTVEEEQADSKGKQPHGILVLTTPDEQTANEENEQIKLAKELLQYKKDTTPISQFDESEWEQLVTLHHNSPCLKDFTEQCMIEQALELLGVIDGKPLRKSHLLALADLAIERQNQKLAQVLIKIWPSAEQLREEEENIPRLRRLTPKAIAIKIQTSQTKLNQLLWTAGEYEKAKTLLLQMHEEYKDGLDYGTISTLTQRGDLDEALNMANMTLEWPRLTPDPNENSTAIMHCYVYADPPRRPTAMGDLAQAFIEQGKQEKAYEVTSLLRRYWENNAFGQRSPCYTGFALNSYLSGMEKLIEAYIQAGNTAKANALYDELISTVKKNTENITIYNKSLFENITMTGAENGLKDPLENLAQYIADNGEIDYKYDDSTDPVAFIYAMAGNYHKTIERLENYEYKDNSPRTPIGKALSQKKIGDGIRITTFLEIAKALSKAGDKKGALLFLEKSTPYIGKRPAKYDPLSDTLDDDITKADILLDLGEKEKSREVLDMLLQRADKALKEEDPRSLKRSRFFGKLYYLYAKHENIETVQKWAEQLPPQNDGYNYARTAQLLIDENRWDELDQYLKDTAHAYATYTQPLSNWHRFTDPLLAAKDNKFLKFLEMVDQETEKMPAEQKPKSQRVSEDTRNQIWLMEELLISGINTTDLPADTLETIWPRYIKNCQTKSYILSPKGHDRNKELDAKETMAACYLSLSKAIAQKERYDF